MELKSEIIKQEDVIKKRLLAFIEKAHNTENFLNTFESILEIHFKLDDKELLSMSLHQHISEMLKIDASCFLDYMAFPKYFYPDDFNFNQSVYRKYLLFINNMKVKYGHFIRTIIMGNKNPFIINSIETNVEHHSATHNIRISRADGEVLRGQFKSDTLMIIITNLLEALHRSMVQGVFSIDSSIIDTFMDKSKELQDYLKELISKEERGK